MKKLEQKNPPVINDIPLIKGGNELASRGIRKSGFTLVELIIVITILAILATIAFISFSGFQRNARDSVRTSDIANIKKALEVFQIKRGTYPTPSSPSKIVTYSGELIFTEGSVGDSVIGMIGMISEKPTDPKFKSVEYNYSVLNTGGKYQIASVLEDGGSIAYMPLISPVFADSVMVYIGGTYDNSTGSVMVGGTGYIFPLPSITTSYGHTGSVDYGTLMSSGSFLGNKAMNDIPSSYKQTGISISSFGGTGVGSNGNIVSNGTPATCGSINGSSGSVAPNNNLCGVNSTLSGSVNGNGPWNWMCASSDGGAPASCSVTRASNPIVVAADCTINTNTTWTAGTYNCDNLLVTNNSTLTLQGNTVTGSGVIINANNITVDAGSKISADGQGYAEASGPGAGISNSQRGSGAGYGGTGGATGVVGGTTYGSSNEPSSLGSGGGHGDYNGATGGNGGGAIKIVVSNTLTINGSISANGISPSTGGAPGGGAGGSIWLNTNILSGNGTITANGGNGSNGNYGLGGGGGGGRIAFYYFARTYNGLITTGGGIGGNVGGIGTIYEKDQISGVDTLTLNGINISNGLCGTNSGKTVLSQPSGSSACSYGNLSNTGFTLNTYTWTCQKNTSNGVDVNCSACHTGHIWNGAACIVSPNIIINFPQGGTITGIPVNGTDIVGACDMCTSMGGKTIVDCNSANGSNNASYISYRSIPGATGGAACLHDERWSAQTTEKIFFPDNRGSGDTCLNIATGGGYWSNGNGAYQSYSTYSSSNPHYLACYY